MGSHWSTKKLGEVIELRYGKGISKYDRKSDGKYIIYGANGELGRTDKYLVEGEAIIVGRKGSAGEVRRVSGKFWPSDVTYYVLGTEKIDIDYLFHLFKSLNLQRFAVGVKPGINRNRIYEIEIPLPPLEIQRKIVERIERLMGKIDEAKKLRKEATADVSSLIPSALNKIFEEGKKKGWEERSLGDNSILSMTSGGTPSRKYTDYYKGNIIWLKSGELNDNQYLNNSAEKISEDALKNSSAKIFPKNTVLFAMYGATAGKLGILDVSSATNQAVAGMICNEKVLYYKYLFYSLLDKRKKITDKAWGGAQPNLSQTIIKNFKIPLPPLSEQRKIVKYLDSLAEKARKIKTLQSETDRELKLLEKSVLNKAFDG